MPIVIAALLGGCSDPIASRGSLTSASIESSPAQSATLTSPSTRAAPTLAPGTDAPRAAPSPPDDLKTRFRTEQNGIRVTIDLERNPMPAGEPTWATVAVKNTGTDDVTWFHDGCARPVGVSGTMPSATWRSGIAQNGQAANFKQRLLERMPEAISISFAPESMTRVGRIGCADIGMSDTIHPGRTIKQRARWDGMAFLRLGLPPPGPLTLQGRAAYYSRGRNQPSETNEGVITLGGQVWISGGKDPAWLDPPEVIDAALTDPALVDWLEGQTLGNGVSEILWFDLKQTLWQVGTLEYGPERLHYVLVDPATGEIRGTVERHWDPGEDGYP